MQKSIIKLISIVLVCAMCFSFVSCSKSKKEKLTESTKETTVESTKETSPAPSIQEAESTTEESTTETTTEATTESTTEATVLTIDNAEETTGTTAQSSGEPVIDSSDSSMSAVSSESGESSSNAYVGEVKNGKVTYEDGYYYITDSSTGVKFLIVNKTYTVPQSCAPGSLRSECNSAFNRLCAAAKADGISISSISGYRSYSRQSELYNGYVARDGKSAADTYSARPGHSEHQTGLAIDCNSLKSSWADTAEGKWLAAHCTEYGFIIRYAKGKESKTGYQYEPWHIRYLGSTELAKKITDSGLCIEEYYGITSSY